VLPNIDQVDHRQLLDHVSAKLLVSELLPFWLCSEAGREAVTQALQAQQLSPGKKQKFLVDSCLQSPSFDELNTEEIGTEVKLDNVRHPVTGSPMNKLVLRKIFASQAKPKLFSPPSGPSLIWKTGDNLFTDFGVMFMGRFLNSLWKQKSVASKMELYGIYPCGTDRGFIECVSNVCAVREYDFNQLRCSREFIASVAGAVLVGWTLGIKDRHQDNQLIVTRSKKTLLIPIDFGFLFGLGPMIDAPRISFPNRMLEQMKKAGQLDAFIEVVVKGFEVLYDSQDKISSLGEYLFPGQFSGYFLSNKTYFTLPREEAVQSFQAKILSKCKGGKGFKHAMKDMVHNAKLSYSS